MTQYSTTLRNNLVDTIDSTIGAGGKLEILDVDGVTILATFVWTGTPFGAGVGGVITLTAPDVNPVTAGNTGVATTARFRTAANVDVITGFTVGTVGTIVIIDNTSINTGQAVTLVFAASTITAPHP